MSTRGIIIIRDKNDNKIIEMYNQMDSYPDGLGEDLQSFIDSGKMVNGLGSNNEKVFNGIECFTAQLVAHLKDGPGGIYLHAPLGTNKNKKRYSKEYGAEYVYEIDSELNMRCWNTWTGSEIFNLKEKE